MGEYSSQPSRREDPRAGWWPSFRRNGYYVRHVTIATLLLLGASVYPAVVLLGRSVISWGEIESVEAGARR